MPRRVPNAELETGEHLTRLEHDARNELQIRAGRDFTDDQWRGMQAKLKDFYAILREWEQPRRDQRKASDAL